MPAGQPAPGRELIGGAIGSIRWVRFGHDARAVADSPLIEAIEIETKSGRYAHLVAAAEGAGVNLRAGPARPPDPAAYVRLWTDLTGALPMAFDGRPTIVGLHPLPAASTQNAGPASAWELELSTGARLRCSIGLRGIGMAPVVTPTPTVTPTPSMTLTPIVVRDLGAADYDRVLALNDGAVPNVNAIPRERLAFLHGASVYCRVAVDASGVAGFLLALDERANYDSPNYRYFRDRYARFVYVDRIVVDPARRGQGIGRLLYEDLFHTVGADVPRIACEVNLEPPNPGSLAFHEQLGFSGVAEQLTERGSKRVCLMIRSRDA